MQLGTSGYRLAQSAPTHVQPMSDTHATPFHARPRNVGHAPSACASTPQPAWHVDVLDEQAPFTSHHCLPAHSPGAHVEQDAPQGFPRQGAVHAI